MHARFLSLLPRNMWLKLWPFYALFRLRGERFNFAKCPFAHTEGRDIPIDSISQWAEYARFGFFPLSNERLDAK